MTSFKGGSPRPARVLFGTLIVSIILFAATRLPDHPDGFAWPAFLRIPVEWPLICLLGLLLPFLLARLLGYLLALFVVLILMLKLADTGAQIALERSFNPYLDIKMVMDGWNIVSGSVGQGVALIAVVVVLLLLAVLVVLLARSWRLMVSASGMLRTGLLVGFGLLAAFGAGLLQMGSSYADLRVAADLTNRIHHVARSVEDMRAFEAVVARGEGPRQGAGLFGRLQGRDVIVIFIESYGRSAIEDPQYANVTGPRLAAMEQEIATAGLQSSSTWVTSPTVGGLSWLAHGTLMSGLWVDNQARYDRLMISAQPSLNRLFSEAGWQTVAVMPAITMDWPEAGYYGYRQILAAKDLGYKGKPFNWVTMPDQYTLSAFERLARVPARAKGEKVMAEIALISSHAPWTPVATMLDWSAVGDGSIFDEQATSGDPPSVVWADPERVRRQYIGTIDYALQAVSSYIANYGSDAVFVILGDHQPARIITGPNASRAVPVHIVSADADLIGSFKEKGLSPGMKPSLDAVEMPMNTVRQILIDTFSGR
ncbi:sulfatase-like hydrolase/transferase [Peteryoungia ipomoeae]|uniref:Sulfatase n=1 Tax=Peteryoungia ipomoeae TaxID=1210932 RepID=A0A4S8NVY9_9HYPH|nr:sulfatase-like hydrolase/transferase [Peteryoungia ipomoeae]THV21045.1 sulfatase [Peteryoungia ipomoeae]